jgi:hypothetical protein
MNHKRMLKTKGIMGIAESLNLGLLAYRMKKNIKNKKIVFSLESSEHR